MTHTHEDNKSIMVFGGTTEGRRICEFCAANALSVYYCTATEDGARAVDGLPGVQVRTGRLDADGMAALFREVRPMLMIDATHPYAAEVSTNITRACRSSQIEIPLIRIEREIPAGRDCDFYNYFDRIEELLHFLADFIKKEQGSIFVTTGSSLAKDFARLPDFRERIWMRILPSLESLRVCLEAGYRPDRLICMQAPFSEELNRTMFRNAGARILVTKNSGTLGGFTEKATAAKSLGMSVAVLSGPRKAGGMKLEEAYRRIKEVTGRG